MPENAWELHSKATEVQFDAEEILLGPWSSYSLNTDPKHLVFVLSRYKFVSKMMSNCKRILEIGCGDGVGAPIIAQSKKIENLVCIDWDKRNIEGNRRRLSKSQKKIKFEMHDINKSSFLFLNEFQFDGAFMIDVIEHVEPNKELEFMKNICNSLSNSGILITGTPNITSAQWASPQSNAQHINLKSQESLAELMRANFQQVFSFGMNDEVLHTGFGPMSHYIWTIAINPIR